jgi:hypothetical protein
MTGTRRCSPKITVNGARTANAAAKKNKEFSTIISLMVFDQSDICLLEFFYSFAAAKSLLIKRGSNALVPLYDMLEP